MNTLKYYWLSVWFDIRHPRHTWRRGKKHALQFFRRVKLIGLRRTLRGENVVQPLTQADLQNGVMLVYNADAGVWERR